MASEYLAPTILSSRRLFGPNRYSRFAGAVLDVVCDSPQARRAVERWPHEVRALAAALHWPSVVCVVQERNGEASLFLTAPLDALLTASDLSEHAWVAAEAWVGIGAVRERQDAVTLLQASYAAEQRRWPHVVAMHTYAVQHALIFSCDDNAASLGAGTGVYIEQGAADDAQADSHGATPLLPSRASWEQAHNIPIVLVTGSNGKTTTTRLVAAMARARGDRVGWSCSDGVWIDEAQVESGDFTGPAGARRVVCERAVEFAVLETARGGMLRRGLAVDRAAAAIITNISADHFGEYGIATLTDLAEAKSTIARALAPEHPLVLNADDATLVAIAPTLTVPVVWFSTGGNDEARARVSDGAARSGFGALVNEGQLRLCVRGQWHVVGAIADMPITLRGAATHNVANVAGAALVAAVAGVGIDAIQRAAHTFGARAHDNPGRLMVRALGDITVILDYAHNPDGIASLCRTAASLPAARRLLLLGQAGNRDDQQLRALAESAWRTQAFDRVVIKEMEHMLRGRAVGEIPAILVDALVAAGAPPSAIHVAGSELEGVRDALSWAHSGDLLVLGVHVTRSEVLSLLDELEAMHWRAGGPLPVADGSPR